MEMEVRLRDKFVWFFRVGPDFLGLNQGPPQYDITKFHSNLVLSKTTGGIADTKITSLLP